jgi:hypothetical protein
LNAFFYLLPFLGFATSSTDAAQQEHAVIVKKYYIRLEIRINSTFISVLLYQISRSLSRTTVGFLDTHLVSLSAFMHRLIYVLKCCDSLYIVPFAEDAEMAIDADMFESVNEAILVHPLFKDTLIIPPGS